MTLTPGDYIASSLAHCRMAEQYLALGDIENCWRHIIQAAYSQLHRSDDAEVVYCSFEGWDEDEVEGWIDEAVEAERLLGR